MNDHKIGGHHITLPKTNIAPENGWLGDYFHCGKAYFRGRAVSFREGANPNNALL